MYRNLITKYTGTCADCGAELPAGTKARYYGRGRLYGVDCHDDTAKTPTAAPILAALLEAAAAASSNAARIGAAVGVLAVSSWQSTPYRRPRP